MQCWNRSIFQIEENCSIVSDKIGQRHSSQIFDQWHPHSLDSASMKCVKLRSSSVPTVVRY